jgi:DNA-binding MarR family transcriptional regulator
MLPIDNNCYNEYIWGMAGKLVREIQQTKPFALLEEEAFLNLVRTSEFLQQRISELFKGYQLTPTQYNLLRILRGAGRDGITCSQAGERMVTHDPDVTRLMDRLEARRLILRERSREDRRVVVTRISDEGLALVNSLDQPIEASMKQHLGHLGRPKLEQLVDLLESLRGEA